MKKTSILLVDDEERILNFLKAKLKSTGYEVIIASNGIEALQQIKGKEPDVMVLDVMMPKMDGFETLKELRTFSSIPVIMLSGRGEDSDKIKGLGMGADDYLSKPFNPDELVVRIESIRRRFNTVKHGDTRKELIVHGLNINFDQRYIIVRGKKAELTRIEWLLLNELVGNSGNLVFYYDLLSRVWGPEHCEDMQLLRTWINRLRQIIENDPIHPQIITTVPRTGYIFNK
jgi:two-component system, OmpR family, KDP operon response regulator KdpE